MEPANVDKQKIIRTAALVLLSLAIVLSATALTDSLDGVPSDGEASDILSEIGGLSGHDYVCKTLTEDITGPIAVPGSFEGTLELDLNGKTITNDGGPAVIVNGGTLSIHNGTLVSQEGGPDIVFDAMGNLTVSEVNRDEHICIDMTGHTDAYQDIDSKLRVSSSINGKNFNLDMDTRYHSVITLDPGFVPESNITNLGPDYDFLTCNMKGPGVILEGEFPTDMTMTGLGTDRTSPRFDHIIVLKNCTIFGEDPRAQNMLELNCNCIVEETLTTKEGSGLRLNGYAGLYTDKSKIVLDGPLALNSMNNGFVLKNGSSLTAKILTGRDGSCTFLVGTEPEDGCSVKIMESCILETGTHLSVSEKSHIDIGGGLEFHGLGTDIDGKLTVHGDTVSYNSYIVNPTTLGIGETGIVHIGGDFTTTEGSEMVIDGKLIIDGSMRSVQPVVEQLPNMNTPIKRDVKIFIDKTSQNGTVVIGKDVELTDMGYLESKGVPISVSGNISLDGSRMICESDVGTPVGLTVGRDVSLQNESSLTSSGFGISVGGDVRISNTLEYDGYQQPGFSLLDTSDGTVSVGGDIFFEGKGKLKNGIDSALNPNLSVIRIFGNGTVISNDSVENWGTIQKIIKDEDEKNFDEKGKLENLEMGQEGGITLPETEPSLPRESVTVDELSDDSMFLGGKVSGDCRLFIFKDRLTVNGDLTIPEGYQVVMLGKDAELIINGTLTVESSGVRDIEGFLFSKAGLSICGGTLTVSENATLDVTETDGRGFYMKTAIDVRKNYADGSETHTLYGRITNHGTMSLYGGAYINGFIENRGNLTTYGGFVLDGYGLGDSHDPATLLTNRGNVSFSAGIDSVFGDDEVILMDNYSNMVAGGRFPVLVNLLSATATVDLDGASGTFGIQTGAGGSDACLLIFVTDSTRSLEREMPVIASTDGETMSMYLPSEDMMGDTNAISGLRISASEFQDMLIPDLSGEDVVAERQNPDGTGSPGLAYIINQGSMQVSESLRISGGISITNKGRMFVAGSMHMDYPAAECQTLHLYFGKDEQPPAKPTFGPYPVPQLLNTGSIQVSGEIGIMGGPIACTATSEYGGEEWIVRAVLFADGSVEEIDGNTYYMYTGPIDRESVETTVIDWSGLPYVISTDVVIGKDSVIDLKASEIIIRENGSLRISDGVQVSISNGGAGISMNVKGSLILEGTLNIAGTEFVPGCTVTASDAEGRTVLYAGSLTSAINHSDAGWTVHFESEDETLASDAVLDEDVTLSINAGQIVTVTKDTVLTSRGTVSGEGSLKILGKVSAEKAVFDISATDFTEGAIDGTVSGTSVFRTDTGTTFLASEGEIGFFGLPGGRHVTAYGTAIAAVNTGSSVEELRVIGSLDVTSGTLSVGTVYLGDITLDQIEVLGAVSQGITGNVESALWIVKNGYSVPDYVPPVLTSVQYKVDGVEWARSYGVPETAVPVVMPELEPEEEFGGWMDLPETFPTIPSDTETPEEEFGNFVKTKDVFTITVASNPGVSTAFVDGTPMTRNGDGSFTSGRLAEGTYHITFHRTEGYTGDGVISAGSVTVDGCNLTTEAFKTNPDGTPRYVNYTVMVSGLSAPCEDDSEEPLLSPLPEEEDPVVPPKPIFPPKPIIPDPDTPHEGGDELYKPGEKPDWNDEPTVTPTDPVPEEIPEDEGVSPVLLAFSLLLLAIAAAMYIHYRR